MTTLTLNDPALIAAARAAGYKSKLGVALYVLEFSARAGGDEGAASERLAATLAARKERN